MSTISKFLTVLVSLPYCPGIRFPLVTFAGQALQPMEPGLRWQWPPWVSRPPPNP
jgi:hypothetical protein